MLAKKAKHVNICDWDLKIHHVVWVYNTTYIIGIRYSPFRLTYGMDALLLIDVGVEYSSKLIPKHGYYLSHFGFSCFCVHGFLIC
jgi:hypothetical protein